MIEIFLIIDAVKSFSMRKPCSWGCGIGEHGNFFTISEGAGGGMVMRKLAVFCDFRFLPCFFGSCAGGDEAGGGDLV